MEATDGLIPTELSMIAEFLEEAAIEFADHGANDEFILPATSENRAICVAVLEHHDDNNPDDEHEFSEEDIEASPDEVFIFDFWAMDYFAERCKEVVKHPATAAVLALPELFAISVLLEAGYVDHEESSDDVCYDLTYPATDENKTIIAGAIKLAASELGTSDEPYRQKVAQTIQTLSKALQESDEIDIPDFWLMHYFADRCKKLSGMPAST